MPGPVFLEGESVELRIVEVEDAEAIQRIVDDPRVREGLTRVDPVAQHQEVEWIESAAESDRDYPFAVCVDDDLQGVVALGQVDHVRGTAELGYYLHPDAWGQGYATDAARTATRYAFDERDLDRLWARVLATNPASRRVLEKVGFVEEGVARDHVPGGGGERIDVHRYGLLADEWRER